jgi:AbrB family looped-hinge helix DNA binding protein
MLSMERGANVPKKKRDRIVLRQRGQITLPKNILKQLDLQEGDSLDVRIEDGKVVIVPMIEIPQDQAWFWTEEWQAGEQEAEKNIKNGEMTAKLTIDEALAMLHKIDEELDN